MTAQRAQHRVGPQDCYEVVSSCPSCGSPLAGDEIFCLQCGTRLVPEPEPRPSWTVPAVIVCGIAVVAAGAVLFALEQVESDAEREATKPVPVFEQSTTADTGPTSTTEERDDIAAWPSGVSAYTVVLATARDEASARARAAAAVASGVPAGVLNADAYPTLEPGHWILFAGDFDNRADALAEAARYAASGYPEAGVEYVSERAG